ncbi:AAA family ATPase [Acetobacteraceae bacterium H6797]|nr:AAA family ATPase [Acetobacteraceae bacterium H6797]
MTAPAFLAAIERAEAQPEGFPFTLPMVAGLERLAFTAPVTFLVGENGSGKSTLLEGLAMGMRAVAVGSHDLARDPSLAAARAFATGFRFVRRRHAKVRLFLRAEDVFGFTRRVQESMAGLAEDEADYARTLPEGYGRRLAMGVMAGQRGALASRYGADPDGASHGETFLNVLEQRLRVPGLYFLDEPEAPLSPARCLRLLAFLRDRAGEGSQFVIATHSPILMALPGAEILRVSAEGLVPTPWAETEHVQVMRAVLANPARVLAAMDRG